jgi:O-antigen/teichoic acid export membrane protein
MGFAIPTLRAAVWAAVQGWGGNLLSTVVFLLLARLLDPEAFGLAALALALITFSMALVGMGLPDALVRHERLEDSHVQSAFWTMMAFALVTLILALVLAQSIAEWLREPELRLVLSTLALALPLNVMDQVFDALLRRKLAFKVLAMRKLVALSAASLIALVLAWLGAGVWSLVAKGLVEALLGVAVLWRLSDWRPRWSVSRQHLKDLLAFGAPMGLGRFVGLLSLSIDKWIVGYNLGVAQVGIYTIGQRLYAQVIDLFPETANRVLMPAFARVQGEPERLTRAFLEAQQLASITTFPMFAGLILTAPDLIVLLLGPRWISSALFLQILCLGGFSAAANYFTPTAWLARGRSDWYLRWTILHSAAALIAIAIGVRWGILGIAAAQVIRGYLLLPIAVVLLKRSLGITVTRYFANLGGPMAATAFMAVCVGALLWALDLEGQPALRLMLAALVGPISFLLGCRWFAHVALTEVCDRVGAAFPQLRRVAKLSGGRRK